MSLFDDTLELINRGKKGYNKGLPFGFDRLSKYIPNIQQGTCYLVAGESGSGKTSVVDDMFVFNPYNYLYELKHNDQLKLEFDGVIPRLKIIYYTLEIERRRKTAKAIARRIYDKYNILIDLDYILSKGKNRISSEIYNYVISTKSYFDELEDIVEFHDNPINPTGINIYLDAYAKQNGKNVIISETKVDDIIYQKTKYIPNNPNLYTIIIVDHVGLIKKEKDKEGHLLDNKGKIDKISEYFKEQRNKHNFTTVLVQQLNRTLAASERQAKFSNKEVTLRIQSDDLKQTGNTIEDSDIVMGLFSPNKYDLTNYDGYNIVMLQDRYRSLQIIKNRDGNTDLNVGLFYLGEIGKFKELNLPNEITEKQYTNMTKIKKHE
jgi:hypothetical protein